MRKGVIMKKILLAVMALLLAACSSASEFDSNLEKWQGMGITHYRYQLMIGCFCPFGQDMPLTIEVENGEVASILRADGAPVDSSDPSFETYSAYATIDLVFSELESNLTEADEITVTYDPLYGFPGEISIDYIKEAMDDELYIQVSNFESIE
jgi:ABC-type glycerol-3-phosphate transport system substrate-binding protein